MGLMDRDYWKERYDDRMGVKPSRKRKPDLSVYEDALSGKTPPKRAASGLPDVSPWWFLYLALAIVIGLAASSFFFGWPRLT